MILLFEIGFLPIRIWDILDILIVGYLIYQLYKLLRGTVAFNIFIGFIFLFILYWVVEQLKMDLLSSFLSQFVSVGVLMLLIVFQPEVRRFLLLLGNSTLRQRSNFLSRLLDRNLAPRKVRLDQVRAVKKAVLRMSRVRTGALIVFANNKSRELFSDSGVVINADISQQLIESIFNKESPIHDGATIIADGKIIAASCILPISANSSIPKHLGLRHRAGIGVTENTNCGALIVSEENGEVAYAERGQLEQHIDENRLTAILRQQLTG